MRHNAIIEEEGFVRCSCGEKTFSDETTELALARYRVHFKAESAAAVGLPAIETARAALEEGQR